MVPTEISTDEYQALAELRYRIRHFLSEGDTVARATGLEPQQYLLLLTSRGLPQGEQATIGTLAERMALKHHSVVELIDRLEVHGYVRRSRGREDRQGRVSFAARLQHTAVMRADALRGNFLLDRASTTKLTGSPCGVAFILNPTLCVVRGKPI